MNSVKTPAVESSAGYAGDFGDRIWLNAAHQGPLPRLAAEAAGDALAAKLAPHRISDEAFIDVPRRLREVLLTGHVIDIAGLNQVCERSGVRLVLNVTQGLGALPFDVRRHQVAAISCSGFKWLCGPYATGFAWIRPDVLQAMRPVQAYWLALPDDVELDLNREGEHRLRDDLGARAYDIFGTANFLNFIPWTAALEYLLAQGIQAIADHDQALVEQLTRLLEDHNYRFISPTDADQRAAIVVISAPDPADNQAAYRRLTGAGVDVALRAGNIRLSPHLYNTPDQIQYAAATLTGMPTAPRTRYGRV